MVTLVAYPAPPITCGRTYWNGDELFGLVVIVKVAVFEAVVPFRTLMVAPPALARSAVVIAAASCVLLTKVVGRAAPFHCTTEVEVKLAPLTVRVIADVPATALLGAMLPIAGVEPVTA